MMIKNAVFVYDGAFRRSPDGTVYSLGGFPASIWSRYLAFAGTLTVAARMVESSSIEGLVPSSSDGVQFVSLPNLSQMRTRITNELHARRIVSELVENTDLVIVRLPSELGLTALGVATSRGIPCAVEVVGNAGDALTNHGRSLYRLYAPILERRTRTAVERSTAAIYVTREFLQAKYPCSGITGFASNVVVDVPVWESIKSAVLLRSRGLRNTIGLIGSMESNYKGVDVAIRAVAQLVNNHDTQLRVLGSGDVSRYAELARRLGLGDRVFFDGLRSSRDEVNEWLDTLDVYIQPSRTEGLPRALIEAMARGLVCIGSRVGGIPELLDSRLTFPSGDHRALAEMLRKTIEMSDTEYCSASERIHTTSQFYNREVNDSRRSEFWEKVTNLLVSR